MVFRYHFQEYEDIAISRYCDSLMRRRYPTSKMIPDLTGDFLDERRFFFIRMTQPPSGWAEYSTSSMKARIHKIPRPVGLSRFSGSSGSSRLARSNPAPRSLTFQPQPWDSSGESPV